MKSILLPVSGTATSEQAMNLVTTIAPTFLSHIHGLYVRPLPPIVAGEGITVPGDYVARIAEEGKEAGVRAFERFESCMQTAGISVLRNNNSPAAVSGQITASWSEVDGVESHVIGEVGRAHDMVLLDRRGGSGNVDWKAAAEATLFESGRPLLLAGEEASSNIASRILLAWNGSTETARVVAMTRSLLRDADAVEVLCVEQGMVPGPDGEQICDYLRLHGVEATLTKKTSGSIGIGETILEHANSTNSDPDCRSQFWHCLASAPSGGPTSGWPGHRIRR